MRHRLRVAGLVLCVAALACTTWVSQPVPKPPAAFRSTRGPVHVVLMDKTSLYLVNVVVATDSLFGVSPDLASIRYAFPLNVVARMEEQRKSPAKSIALFLAVAIALVVL